MARLSTMPDSPSIIMRSHGSTGDVLFSPQSSASETPSVYSRASTIYNRHFILAELPKRIKDVQYAVRGAVVLRAYDIEKEMAEDPEKYPFKKIVMCNIGNPQEVGQPPLTHIRQCLSLLANPAMLDSPVCIKELQIPGDIVAKARRYLHWLHTVGCYSHSKGVPQFREIIAKFLLDRDGFPVDAEHIFLLDGASAGCTAVLETLIEGPQDGIMIPSPQYPLYAATITSLNGTAVPYFLNEESRWGVDTQTLEEAANSARAKNIKVKALVVINPGNPTGSVLSREDMVEIIQFCEREDLIMVADEVYQECVFSKEKPFVSFRKQVIEMASPVQLVSFHSGSKGFYGECGLRAGFMVYDNVAPNVLEVLYKMRSIKLCPNTVGQAAMTMVCSHPKEGDSSFPRFSAERASILSSLAEKAECVPERINRMKYACSQPIEGALYAYPTIKLPKRFIAKAEEEGRAPDLAFCLELLENTGLLTVPGSGFGQREGTWHLRLTILPPKDELMSCLDAMERFHEGLFDKYAD